MNWIYTMSFLGCAFVVAVLITIAYKLIFKDQNEDGCMKYGCGVVIVFIGVYITFITAAYLGEIQQEERQRERYCPQDNESVYICTGETSTKYHCDQNCHGLSNCSGEIDEVSKDEAEEMGRTPCKICY